MNKKMADVKLKVTSVLLADYLRHIFPSAGDGDLRVSASNSLGKLLIAHARETSSPVEIVGENVMPLTFPVNSATQVLKNRFLYYPEWSVSALNMALSATFDYDFTGYYRAGEAVGMDKKDIVDGFIFSRHLFSMDYFDTLHKRAYRRELRDLEALRNKLIRRVYYINECINKENLTK